KLKLSQIKQNQILNSPVIFDFNGHVSDVWDISSLEKCFDIVDDHCYIRCVYYETNCKMSKFISGDNVRCFARIMNDNNYQLLKITLNSDK
ncbi:hypothetical protein MXB_1792, partial [Myxobolus squamalis]